MTTPEAFTPEPVRENYLKGTLFALIALPIGVILWVVIWSFGFISAIVALAIAAAAAWLYRKGAGGTVSLIGALIVTAIVIVTLLIAFWAGMVVDYANAVAAELRGSIFDALAHPMFWTFFQADFPVNFELNLGNFGLALLFGALGAFGVLRGTFMGAKQGAAGPAVAEAPAAPGATPAAPVETAAAATEQPAPAADVPAADDERPQTQA